MNRVLLQVQIVERGPLRYTPAGLPVVDLRLAHAGQVAHEGSSRQVSFEMHASAVGELVKAVDGLAMGSVVDIEGFLTKQRNGRGVMLQITRLALSDSPITRSTN